MRRASAPPDELIEQIKQSPPSWKPYRCTLVTPMYGGGVTAGEVDAEMPIRASSIRGQLRFWWRIACAHGLDAKEMFARETAIWGGIGSEVLASKVAVRVSTPRPHHWVMSNEKEYDEGIKYIFGAAAINGAARWLQEGYSFELHVRCSDEVRDDVMLALRWWATFGGVGARTRRGFGAVHIPDLDGGVVTEAEILAAHCIVQWQKRPLSALKAWKEAAAHLQTFRQGKGFARRDGKQRPGRSYWPEPDQLRRDTGKNDNGRHQPEHKGGNVFPRAAFGMPIIFDFHKLSEPDKNQTELLPRDGERMASPLILRPYPVENGKFWPAALLLPTWKDALAMPLRYKGLENKTPQSWTVAGANAAQHIRPTEPGKDGPMVKANGQPRASDPLSAFMQFFKEGK